ncbi:MAG: hypothetical protein P8Z81_00515 [Deinococcales bacterium]
MTDAWTASRIAQEQANDVMKAARQHRLARSAAVKLGARHPVGRLLAEVRALGRMLARQRRDTACGWRHAAEDA